MPQHKMQKSVNVAIIGAGAAGMMAAAEAGKWGKSVWLGDHRANPGEKIRISGGGRCNFTNIHTSPDHFLSGNPHFVKSALAQYSAQDFIDQVQRHGIAYHEKKLGQLFCDHSAKDIINMLVDECRAAAVDLSLSTDIHSASYEGGQYHLKTSDGNISARALIVACGGLSIPKIGATGFGYDLARQFGLDIIAPRAGLVPLTFNDDILDHCRGLAGVSVDASVQAIPRGFQEGLLFTHRGLSGPSILQVSSYWQDGEDINVNLAPDVDAAAFLKTMKADHPKQDCATALAKILPKRLAQSIMHANPTQTPLGETSDKHIEALAAEVNRWRITPAGTEGYRTAEVTLGGVNTGVLNSKTMECRSQPGLFFIGEVVDVTGHLGGFNFQWAWSSGVVAGQNA